jgi:hypothetical protein
VRQDPPFEERDLVARPIRDLGLRIEGTTLEPVVQAFLAEVERLELPFRPRPYLSTEWGVPMGTIAIAIPFYLARSELTALHARRTGHLEGANAADILRYLRHEMGHVVNYAYQLYEEESWIAAFGSITQPYVEEYRPEPFSRRFVRHLPGWYAQKHPDEDWAETFAVWMTPGRDWRADYAAWPVALGKLELCDRTVRALRGRPPVLTDEELDEDVGELATTLGDYYAASGAEELAELPGIDGALRAVFDETTGPPAAELIAGASAGIIDGVFRWTGLFPERTRTLLRHLETRARALDLAAGPDERAAVVSLTALVTALAMNQVVKGSYLP